MSSDHDKRARRVEAFGDILIAAMDDAASERKLTQLLTEITPERTGRKTRIRIIVVPETMDMEWSEPLESRK